MVVGQETIARQGLGLIYRNGRGGSPGFMVAEISAVSLVLVKTLLLLLLLLLPVCAETAVKQQ